MAIFTKPENALKRADELINIGKNQDALQALHGLITSKSYRSWQKPHENIMFRFVELCVELRRGQFAKDGLIQYRIACQQVNVSSFEEVFKHYLHLATEKVEQAHSQADALEEDALDVVDLEADKQPEDLQLSIVSGEKGKDRSDRKLVTPWLKFLWETYRTVLEILRNNSKLEALYAMTAHKAFQFCKQYKRTKEFRRLCEMIRNHLANLNKYRDQRDRPDLTAPESLQLYLDTRFEQLKVSTELGLWQEAFCSAEDIYGLMCMVNKTPKSSLLVVYYSKLTEIFWNYSSHIYHAYAWFKLFSLQKNFNKNLNQKDLQLIASSVVLAALSGPPYGRSHGASHLELENEKELNLRMSNLIEFNLEPKLEGKDMLSRASLLSELVSRGVLSCATQEVKDLYYILEHEFHPLDLGSKIKPLLDKISKLGGKLSSAPSLQEVHLSQYVPSLKKIATLKLLQQASKIYQTITIKNLAQLVPFFDFSAVETISVDAVRNNFVAMKVDHMKGVVLFGNLSIESDGLKDPLTIFAETMNKVRAMLFPAPSKASKLGEIVPNLGETVGKEHKRLLARKSIIEKRKEEQERQQLEMECEEEQRRLKLLKLTEAAEQKRLATELEERRRQRMFRKIEERELEEAKALLEETEKRQKKGKTKTLFDGEKVTKQTVMERAMSEKRKEDQEMEKKLRKLAHIMDYLERAKREEAAPLIEAAYQQRLVEERKLYEHEQQREVELSKECHESDLMEKNRLARPKMLDNKEVFQKRVIRLRQVEFDRLRMEKEERIGQIIRARKEERDIKRKRIYHLNSEEERINKLREEEEARKREETEKRRKEDAEQKAKLDEIAEKQRQRERELEEKKRLRRETLLKPTNAFPARSLEPTVAATAEATTAHSQSPAKYVPKFRRSQATEVSGSAPALPPAESDCWGNRARPPAKKPDQCTSGREKDAPLVEGDRWEIRSNPKGSEQPGGDAWRSEEGRSASENSSSRSSFPSRTSQR